MSIQVADITIGHRSKAKPSETLKILDLIQAVDNHVSSAKSVILAKPYMQEQ